MVCVFKGLFYFANKHFFQDIHESSDLDPRVLQKLRDRKAIA